MAKKDSATITTDLQHRVFIILMILGIIGVLVIFIPYLSSLLLAVILALIFHPVYQFLGRKTKFKTTVKVALTTLLFFLIVITPFVILGVWVIGEIPEIAETVQELQESGSIDELVEEVTAHFENLPLDDSSETLLNDVLNSISTAIVAVVASLGEFLISLVASFVTGLIPLITSTIIFIAAFVSLLPNLDKFFKFFDDVSPFDKKITDMFVRRISDTTKNMVLASITVSVINGFIVGIMFWILGIPFAGFAAMLCMLLGFIPLVGPSLVTVPVSIILIIQGDWLSAVIILGVHFFLMNNVDLMVRPIFQTEEAKINPVILAISVLGGIAVFGLLGVIYGPIIVIFFITCLEIYMKNFAKGGVWNKAKKIVEPE